jgi:hypothetical protein
MIDISSVRSVRRRKPRLGDATGFQAKSERKDNRSYHPAMNCLFFRWSSAALFACLTCASSQAVEYCLRPDKENGGQAESVVCCSAPAGWQGWKDDPHQRDRIKRLDAYSKGFLRRLVSFHQSNCKQGWPECPYLSLKTTARDSRGQPDVEAGLREFLDESEQPQDLSPRKPPCAVVGRYGSFHTENSGDSTIWQVRCPSGEQHFVTLLAQRDMLMTIDLGAPAIKDIVPKLDSLKELARSVRIIDASLALPDIVEINVDHLSDAAIKQQLLQLTPLGTRMEKVYEVLDWHLWPKESPEIGMPGKQHWINGDLQMQIGSYPNPGPFATLVQAVWKSDKQHKLRDIEIRRFVIDYKSKRALPVKKDG